MELPWHGATLPLKLQGIPFMRFKKSLFMLSLALTHSVISQSAAQVPAESEPGEVIPGVPYVPSPYGYRKMNSRMRWSVPGAIAYECIDAPPTVEEAKPTQFDGKTPCPDGQYAQKVLPPKGYKTPIRGVIGLPVYTKPNPDGSSFLIDKKTGAVLKRFNKNGVEVDEYGNPVKPESNSSSPQASRAGRAGQPTTDLVFLGGNSYRAYVAINIDNQNTGVEASLLPGKPEVEWYPNQVSYDVFSLAQISVGSDQDGTFTVEFGWGTEPERFGGDTTPRLFLAWNVNGSQRQLLTPTASSPDFVKNPVSPNIGDPITANAKYSIRHFGADSTKPSRWSVFLNGTELGYLRDTVFNSSGSFTTAQNYSIQGEVAVRRGSPLPCSDMGTGAGSPEPSAATVTDAAYYDVGGAQRSYFYSGNPTLVTDPSIYSFRAISTSGNTISSWAYGGPGSGLCRKINFIRQSRDNPNNPLALPTDDVNVRVIAYNAQNQQVGNSENFTLPVNGLVTKEFRAEVIRLRVEYNLVNGLQLLAPKLCNYLVNAPTDK
jgi:hypothetical protein